MAKDCVDDIVFLKCMYKIQIVFVDDSVRSAAVFSDTQTHIEKFSVYLSYFNLNNIKIFKYLLERCQFYFQM